MTRFQANLVLLLAAALWGSGNVAQKLVLEHLGPLTTVGFRGVLAALVVLPLAWRENRRARRFTADDLWLTARMSILFVLGTVLSQVAYGGTTVTNAGFLTNTSTIVTPILVFMVTRIAPGRMVWMSALMTLAGIWLLGGGSWATLTWGDGVSLAAALAYSMWIIDMCKLAQSTGRPSAAAFIQFVVTAIAGCAIGLPLEPVTMDGFIAASPYLLYLGVVSTGLGFALSAIAQACTPAAEAGILMSGESLFGALAAALLLGERLGPTTGFGAALIFGAIVLVQLPQDLLVWRAIRMARWLKTPRRSAPRISVRMI